MIKTTKQPLNKSKLFAIFLYLLPVIFFIISYFFITTSGEDIFQGANSFRSNNTLNPIKDALNAFSFNGRVTDMYAWAVIDFYDYQFSFGPDIIFRLIDVVMASSVFYFATYIIQNRRPKLIIKDALIFCATFVTFIITPFGRNFYLEFSMIHNYVPLTLVTIIFSVPFLKLLTGNCSAKHQKLLNIILPFLGLYFGMATTITPLAFFITVVFYCVIRHKNLNRPPLWFFTGLVCLMVGFLISWFAGPGINHYATTQANTFDYVPLSSLLSNPLSAIPKILWHEVYNFGIVLLPLLGLFIICLVFKKTESKLQKLVAKNKNLILVFSIFIVIHLLGASLIKAPFRILIPAYLAGIIIILKIFVPSVNSKLIGIITAIMTLLIVCTHAILLLKYQKQAAEILTKIKNSSESSLCVDESLTTPTRLHFIDLSQANFLVDWGYPEPIYGKDVTFCK